MAHLKRSNKLNLLEIQSQIVPKCTLMRFIYNILVLFITINVCDYYCMKIDFQLNWVLAPVQPTTIVAHWPAV